jgi:hypothetical protein
MSETTQTTTIPYVNLFYSLQSSDRIVRRPTPARFWHRKIFLVFAEIRNIFQEIHDDEVDLTYPKKKVLQILYIFWWISTTTTTALQLQAGLEEEKRVFFFISLLSENGVGNPLQRSVWLSWIVIIDLTFVIRFWKIQNL